MKTKIKNSHRFVQMKKWIAIFIVLLGYTQVSNAQEGFKIGPTVGINSSKPVVTDTLFAEYNFRYKFGTSFGLAIQYGWDKRMSIGTGINYVSKGYRVFNDSNRVDNEVKSNFKSLEIPLNVARKFRFSANSKLRAVMGVSLNYILNNNVKTVSNKNSTFLITETETKKMSYLLNMGLEFVGTSKSGNITTFSFFYKHSFENMSNLNVRNQPNTNLPKLFSLGYKGSYLGLSIGYLFDVKNFKRREEVFTYLNR